MPIVNYAKEYSMFRILIGITYTATIDATSC